MKVALKTKTIGLDEYEGKTLDEIIVGIARISSSREVNELFDEPHKLLRHCLSEGHWSVFGTVNLGFEITTSRAIAREFLRHSCLHPQERSLRYAQFTAFENIEIRQQATNNRQSSTDLIDPIVDYEEEAICASDAVKSHLESSSELYSSLLKANVARECARMVLPETAQTVLYFNGNIRSWITTLNQRLHKTAQKEARLVAEAIRDIFMKEVPIISKMLFDFEDAYEIHLLDRLILEKYGVYSTVKENNFKKVKLT